MKSLYSIINNLELTISEHDLDENDESLSKHLWKIVGDLSALNAELKLAPNTEKDQMIKSIRDTAAFLRCEQANNYCAAKDLTSEYFKGYYAGHTSALVLVTEMLNSFIVRFEEVPVPEQRCNICGDRNRSCQCSKKYGV